MSNPVEKYGLEIFGFLAAPQARRFLDLGCGDGRPFRNVEIAAALLGCTVATREVLLAGLNPVRRSRVTAYLDDYRTVRQSNTQERRRLKAVHEKGRDVLLSRLGPWLGCLKTEWGIEIAEMLGRADVLPAAYDHPPPPLGAHLRDRYQGIPFPPSEDQPRLDALNAPAQEILDFWHRHAVYQLVLGPERFDRVLSLVEDDYSHTLVTLALDDVDDALFTTVAAARRAALCATLDRRLRLMVMAVLALRYNDDRRQVEMLMAATAGEAWTGRPPPVASATTDRWSDADPELATALRRMVHGGDGIPPVAENEVVKVDRWQSDGDLIAALLRLTGSWNGTPLWLEDRFPDFDPFFRWALFGTFMDNNPAFNLTAMDQRRTALLADFDLNLRLVEQMCLGMRHGLSPPQLLRRACTLRPATLLPTCRTLDPGGGWEVETWPW